MDIELTTLDSPRRRTARIDRQDESLRSPQRFHRSHHQGPQSGIARIGRIRATTVAALQTGGASQSKWARRSRPWNVSTSTTVVASLDEVFESTIFESVLRFASTGDEAGRSRGRSLRPRCPKGQPHQRSPRRECVRAGGPRRSVFANPGLALVTSKAGGEEEKVKGVGGEGGRLQIRATTRWIASQIFATSPAPVTKGGMV